MLSLALAALFALPTQEGLPSPAPFRKARLAQRSGDGLVLTGCRFEVHVHFDDVAAGRSALETVEASWPVAMELLDAKGTEPPYPLEVHLYPTREAYMEVEAILTDGYFRNTGSFAHWNSKTAHVAMAPPLDGPAAERIVLSGQTREVLLHEAAHLATYVVLPTYRWHPTWFSEGLAMYVEQETARRLGMLGAPGEHPRYSTDQVLLQNLLERDGLPSIDKLLGESLEDLRFHERYALQLEFFSLLVERYPERFRDLIARAKELRGGGAFRQGMAAFMDGTFDKQELALGLRERIARLTPDWYMEYRSFDIEGPVWTQAAFPDTPAVAWRTQPVGQSVYRLSGALQLLGREMSVLLNRVGRRHLSVTLHADGRIVATREDAGRAEPLAQVTCTDLAEAGPHDFRIEADGPRLEVWVNDQKRLELDTGEASLAGAWGLAVPPSCAGVWCGVELGD